MGMVFCRGCGKEIHESAPTCPHCGAPQGKPSCKGELPFASYDQVPWYRKNWFAFISFFAFPPALLIALLTGGIYYEKKGQLKRYSIAAKIFFIILCLIYTGQLVNWVVQRSDSSEVKMVKGGVLESCPNHTVDQMVAGFMGSPSWRSGKSDDGKMYVDVGGDITYEDKPVRATIQYEVKGNNFSFHAFEMNGVPSATLIAIGLMEKMCASAKSSVEPKTAEKAPETATPAVPAPVVPVPVVPVPADTPAPPAEPAAPAPVATATQPVAPISQPSEADILSKYKASFDCNKASTNVEKLTCSTAVLNQLDGLLAGTYKERMTDPAFGVDQAVFKADQLTWVKTRNSCGDAACLEKSYRQRVADLCGMPVISGVHPGGDCDVIQN